MKPGAKFSGAKVKPGARFSGAKVKPGARFSGARSNSELCKERSHYKILISQLSPDSVTKMGDKHRQCHQDGLISTSIFGILNVMHLSKV